MEASSARVANVRFLFNSPFRIPSDTFVLLIDRLDSYRSDISVRDEPIDGSTPKLNSSSSNFEVDLDMSGVAFTSSTGREHVTDD